jgi:nitrate/nitrite-specific signal transduction histidine kinase
MRIVREALANVVKHAGADAVRVELREEPGDYVLRVLDDGRGITVHEDSGRCTAACAACTSRPTRWAGAFAVTARPRAGTRRGGPTAAPAGHPDSC